MRPKAEKNCKPQKNEISSVLKSSTEIKLDNHNYQENHKITNAWNVNQVSNLRIRLKKLPDSNFKEVSDDSSSEEEQIEGSEEKEWDLNSEDGSASDTNSDEDSEEESEEGCNNSMIPLTGPFNCTICELKTMNRIAFIEHIVEFHEDEIDEYDISEGARLKLILTKHYEEKRVSVNNESTSEDEESEVKMDEEPGLKFGGGTEVCSSCNRRIYKSLIEIHSLNCRSTTSELNPGPILHNKSTESDGINNNSPKNATLNENTETEVVENNKKAHIGDDTSEAAGINDDHATTGVILKKTPNGWISNLHPGKKSKSKKINNRPNHYMTKSKIIEKKKQTKEAKKYMCKKAIEAWHRGEYNSVRTCAADHKIPKSTLYMLIETGEEYRGSGAYSKRLTPEEEVKIVKHVSWRSSIGCGVSWFQLSLLLQEIFLKIKEETPERNTGFEHQNQMPNYSFVRRFAERNNLSLRKTNEISKGRQILTVEDLKNWQQETRDFFFGDNKQLSDALKDPRRIFNQDETAIEMGATSQRVLAEKGTKVLFNVSSGSRDHLTASFIVNAKGEIVPPRLVYKGKRNIAAKKLSNLDKTGRSGTWKFSVANKGYMTRELYCDGLRDLDEYLTKNKIDRPVALFVDGATPHISQEAAALCKKFKIQPWLFKPNMTHILQPLDLTFFSSLKSNLKKTVWEWQCSPQNTGDQLNRYSIVPLLYEATEKTLENSDTVKNGFKRAGLFPWDESMPDKSKLLPGGVFSKGGQEHPEVGQLKGKGDQQDTEPGKKDKEVEHEDTEAGQKAIEVGHKEKEDSDEDSVGSGGDKTGRSETEIEKGEECYNKEKMTYRLKTVPHFTMEERRTHLNKFEVVLLSAHQIKEFDMLRKQNIQSKDALFQAWLSLKVATLEPESSAVAKVLSEKKVENIPSRKRKINQVLPTGAARYNPASNEWIKILDDREEKKCQKENKRPKIPSKNKK